jgi:hypothetical protein
MRRFAAWSLFILLLILSADRVAAESPVFSLVAEFDRMAAQSLWPGFDARKIPLELYDRTDTYLVRHPSPPKEFLPVEGHPGFLVFSGRHSTMRANTSIEIAGVMTATLGFEQVDTRTAAILVHECFHVFQARAYPQWTANEAVLFTYPMEDAVGLALARLETEAMSHALAASRSECWTARMLALRRERLARLPAEAAAYERGTELHEGLAQYVEGLAAGRKDVPFRSFAPGEFRLRGYVSGEGLARLLDRLRPGWKSKMADSFDDLFPKSAASECDFTAEERKVVETKAQEDVAKLEHERVELLQAFQSQPGWRILVETADGKPLWPEAFDPINVTRLSEKRILHKRWLKLKNESGSLEILNHGSMTEAAGAHPLFNGVRQWGTAGLTARPEVKQEGRHVLLTAPGCKLDFSNADIEWHEESVTVRLR